MSVLQSPSITTKEPNEKLRKIVRLFRKIYWRIIRVLPIGWIFTRVNLAKNNRLTDRKLEIGPGNDNIAGFEALDVIWRRNVEYVADAAKKLPFKANTFQVVYASHILEHIPWYRLEDTLREWVRILKPGGELEIWVPNGLEICRTFVDFETTGEDRTEEDGWYRYNPEKDPCLWAAGRIFTYGDGDGEITSPNWHRAIFSPRYLLKLFSKVGLTEIHKMDSSDVRGYDHGWINLGFRGTKK